MSAGNPFWARMAWWVEPEAFEAEFGRAPQTVEEYVAWSQERQRAALAHAVRRYAGPDRPG